MKKLSFLILLLLFSNGLMFSQIAINTDGSLPNNSAMLDVKSTLMGFLPPRMNTTERDAIGSPATGLIIYNTDCNNIQYFNGAGWVPVGNAGMVSTPGSISGNSGPCMNAVGEIYTITTVSGAIGYNWTVPDGATIAAGQGTSSITVNFGTSNGFVCASAYGNCWSSLGACLEIILLPVPSTPIAGTHVPSETQIVWNWNTVSGATGYRWSATNDYASATDMGTATTITQTGLTCNTPYTSYVWAYNSCGNSTPATLTQTTSACAPVCPGTVSYGGQTYNTVQIGTQCWFKENLNIGTMINGNLDQTDNAILEKYCYNNDVINCNTYGGLYQWNEMMQWTTTEGVQGICPTGWHLPTDGEWTTLTTFLGGELIAGGKMKEVGTSHWMNPNYNATNSSGFTALPGGTRYNGNFYSLTILAYFWSSTELSSTNAWYRDLYYMYETVNRTSSDKPDGLSARCLKDECTSYVPVSVLIAPSANPVCSGTTVTFTATPTNGGTTPAYQWSVNGTSVAGAINSNYNYAPANNDAVTCVLTSNAPCITGNPATSNTVTMTITPLPVSPVAGTHVPSETQIVWNWNTVSGATGYRWSTTNIYASATDLFGATTTTQTGLTCNTPYTSYVWAYNSCGNSTPATLTQTTSACAPVSCPGVPTVSYGGQTYNTVQIGTQCWFKENLNIGTMINGSLDQTNNATPEKYCYGDDVNNCNTYGGLYQWDEMMDWTTTEGAQGICPTGWHLPTDGEWTTLTTYLGGGSIAGGKMKETGLTHWAAPNTGATNSSGFTALPGGYRYSYGYFDYLTNNAYFWSSTEYSSTLAWYRYLYYNNELVYRYNNYKILGFSARCIKDECTSYVPVSVLIAPSANPVCSGTTVTFTATPTNGGTTPAYQWKVNGTSVAGAINSTYNYAPANNDAVTCVLTSNAPCITGNPATSNTVTMTITPLPVSPVAGTHVPSETQIVWNWNTVSGATGYRWSTTNNYASATDMGTNTTTTQTGLTCNTPYTSYVWAYNSCGNSTPATLTQTTSACAPISCPGIPTVSYGGQTYNTVQIGTQCWFKENLNIGTMINGSQNQTNNPILEKYCYGDDVINCNTYGGLYQWDEMMDWTTTEGAQGICPTGWHIPTDGEWTILTDFLGGVSVAGGKMKEAGTAHWAYPNTGATNSSGFTALPGGSRNYDGNFSNLASHTQFWSSTEYSSTYAWYRLLYYGSANVYRYSGDKTYGFSVRCIKD